MPDEPGKGLNAYGAYALVALCGGAASAVIAGIAFNQLHQITDTGMTNIAVMVAAPSAMAVGVAYFVYRTALQIRD